MQHKRVHDRRTTMPNPAPGAERLWQSVADCARAGTDGTILPPAHQQQLIAAAAQQCSIAPAIARSIIRGYLAVFAIGHRTMILWDVQRIPLLQALTAAQQEE